MGRRVGGAGGVQSDDAGDAGTDRDLRLGPGRAGLGQTQEIPGQL